MRSLVSKPFAALSLLGLLFGFATPGWSHEAEGGKNDPPSLSSLFGGSFSLIDHEGVRRSDKDFAGSYLLVSFGYTRCPTICPTDLETASAALDILDRKSLSVQPLFVSVDPGTDRPEVLKAYLAPFHARFIGLTGSEAEVRAAARAYRVHRRRVALDEDSGGGPEGYLVDHGSITHLMGPDGKFLTLFPFGTDAEFMAETIEGYLR